MKNSYEDIVKVMGTAQSQPYFQKLVDALQDEPEIFLQTDIRTEYFFTKSGIYLSFLTSKNAFSTLFFEGRPKHKAVYSGAFPKGIEFGDSQDVVEKKLSERLTAEGVSESHETYFYEFECTRMRFFFLKPKGPLYLVGAELNEPDISF